MEPSLSLDDYSVILEMGISKLQMGDSASGDSVVDGDKGVKLVLSPYDWGSGQLVARNINKYTEVKCTTVATFTNKTYS